MRARFGLIAAVLACSSAAGPDYAPRFSGLWSGTAMITTPTGGTDTQAISLIIAQTGPNRIALADLCNGHDVPATVRDATSFDVDSYSCGPTPLDSCAAASLVVTGGKGLLSGQILAIQVHLRIDGCGPGITGTLVFQGNQGRPSPVPSAQALAPKEAQILEPVPIGVIATDPYDQALTVAWQLSGPAGSNARIADPSARDTSFTPDLAGDYIVTVTASNGFETSPASAALIHARGFILNLTAPAHVQRNEQVTWTALAATETVASWSWTITGPSGVIPQENRTGTFMFQPHEVGRYTAAVTATSPSGALGKASAAVQVHPGFQELGFRPLQVDYSGELGVIATSASPDVLHIVPAALFHSPMQVSLPHPARSLALDSTGRYAVVGHDGAVTHVDLWYGRILKVWPISVDAGSVVLGYPVDVGGARKQFAYIIPAAGDPVTMRIVDLDTGSETVGPPVISGSQARLLPQVLRMFSVDPSGAPGRRIRRFDFGNDGTATEVESSAIPNAAGSAARIWTHVDGRHVLVDSGDIFDVATSSWTAAGFNQAVRFASWYLDGNVPGWLLQLEGGDDTSFAFWEPSRGARGMYPGFARNGLLFPVHGSYLFGDPRTVTVLGEVDSTAGVADGFVMGGPENG